MTLVTLCVLAILAFAGVVVYVWRREVLRDRRIAAQFNSALDRVLHEE